MNIGEGVKKLIVISGISGAGRSQALKCLEDLGFYCIDNLPINLIPEIIDTCKENLIGLGIDTRAGQSLHLLSGVLEKIKKQGVECKILFLDSSTETLLRRFSETRRKHPLGDNLLNAIERERKLMNEIKAVADRIIDTTNFTIGDLKQSLSSFLKIKSTQKLLITLISFGYKYGIPLNVDILFDVRFLPNPNYVEKLRNLNGSDKRVKSFVLNSKITKKFLKHISSLLKFLLPQYIREGKSYLAVGIGCTGGKHRSMVIVDYLGEFLEKQGFNVRLSYRDVNK